MVGTAAWPVAARGQQAEMPAVGFLRSAPSEPFTHLERSHRGQLAWAVMRDVRSSDPSARAPEHPSDDTAHEPEPDEPDSLPEAVPWTPLFCTARPCFAPSIPPSKG